MTESMHRLVALMLAAGIAGCGGGEEASSPAAGAATDGAPESTWLASEEPADAVPVGDARQSADDESEVVLVGLIGGSAKPFIDGIAAFTIVDPKVPYCAPDEGCPTPWDYCCQQDQVKDNIAMVKVTDSDGQPVAEDARQLLGVSELSTVVVQGTAQRDDQGNFTVLADQIFVRD